MWVAQQKWMISYRNIFPRLCISFIFLFNITYVFADQPPKYYWTNYNTAGANATDPCIESHRGMLSVGSPATIVTMSGPLCQISLNYPGHVPEIITLTAVQHYYCITPAYPFEGAVSGSSSTNFGPGSTLRCQGSVAPLSSLKAVPDPIPQTNGTCPATTKPIAYATGNKVLREVDYVSSNTQDLGFSRTYNSTGLVAKDNQGLHWRNELNRSILPVTVYVYAYRPGGKVFTFIKSGTDWIADLDVTDKLIELKDLSGVRIGWTYKSDSTGETETYDASGKLLSITAQNGFTKTMVFSCKTVSASCPTATPVSVAPIADMLIGVVDSLGHSVRFTYDSQFRISKIINPAGGVYQYTYDANNNLASVTYPDITTKTYHYGEVGHVAATPAAGVSNANLLTGITDENGNRYADYYYDAQGRAFDENLAGGVEATNLVYNTDGAGNPISTIVTDSRGNVRTHNFTTVLGVARSTGQSQPAGSGCAAAASALTYDANGNVASRVDFNGNKTTFTYDMARNLEISRTEGLTSADTATAATRTVTTSWHATWRLPLVISEFSGASATGTPLKRTTYTYDEKSNITSIKEEDPTRNLTRTITTSYSYSTAVPGLVLQKVVNGSRTDVSDTTTYVYYPHDAVCAPSAASPLIDPITATSPVNLGCRGQLQSVTNARGQVTTFDRYNHHGQIEQMTSVNGVITTLTYDLRQRLLSRSVGNTVPETTSMAYDDAGQIVQLTMPDASTLNYSYDPAHRLNEVQDTLGNKVSYTLDTEGNRTHETLSDPQGNLSKTITRSFDALNRVQQMSGVE